jgi:hypothetical protein
MLQRQLTHFLRRYNGPDQNGQPKPYITKHNLVDLLPKEAFYEMKSMLFDAVDSTVITDFLMRVKEFSAVYRVQVRFRLSVFFKK